MRAYSLFPLLVLSACGPSQAEYDKLATERTRLQQRVSELEAQVDELNNGAPRRLAVISSAFQAGNYAEVVSSAREIAARHPGRPETEKARALASRAEARIAEQTRQAEAAAEAVRRNAERSERDHVRSVVRVRRLWTDDPNSAGGVDLHIVWQNTSSKTVKYATFTVQPYNAVGDVVSCSIRDYSEFSGQVTGPVRPGRVYGAGMSWETAWYNPTIVRAQLMKIHIEYTDGSTVDFSGDQARLAIG
jgi:hypothetical protein